MSMGRDTHKVPESDLCDGDRAMIAEARGVLKRYGIETHPDIPDPLTELGYEQRMARGRALELAVKVPWQQAQVKHVAQAAEMFYDFIWSGKVPD